jgi:hypothetical protein
MLTNRVNNDGPTVVDISFPNGRIIFDREPIFSQWKTNIETRYYFKSLIETLTPNP